MKNNTAPSYIVMGVSGVGKTTVGKKLANRLQIPFYDADDFHPKANIEKMSQGQPLNDVDRLPWLQRLHEELRTAGSEKGMVLACSALKQSYRQVLRGNLPDSIRFIFLDASYEFILQRIEQRKNHFMPPSLLQSQFKTLETPATAWRIDAQQSIPNILQSILQNINC